jgi:hypothetical protein
MSYETLKTKDLLEVPDLVHELVDSTKEGMRFRSCMSSFDFETEHWIVEATYTKEDNKFSYG